MATYSVTSSPQTVSDGTLARFRNDGDYKVILSWTGGRFVLWPASTRRDAGSVTMAAGSTVTARSPVGTNSLDVTAVTVDSGLPGFGSVASDDITTLDGGTP